MTNQHEPPSENQPAPTRKDALFRAEAVAEQQSRWLGSVLLVPRLSHTVYTGVATVLVAG